MALSGFFTLAIVLSLLIYIGEATRDAFDPDNDLKKDHVLNVKQLTVTTETGQVLVDQLSFDLAAGETVAIVGESGSGKSVSSLALLGLLPSHLNIQGQACLNDQDLLALDAIALRQIRGQKIAMIFQEPMTALNPLHRVEKIIGETLLLQGWPKTKVREKVIALLNDVGIPEPEQKLRRYPHELSGGQRQRVMIAMALALEPDILIADEPTTALDVTLQTQILNLLKQLQQQRNMAMILISHDLNLVKRYADHVIVMNKGKVEEQGAITEIFTRPQASYTQHLLDHDFGQAIPYVEGQVILQLEH
ncbi:oligopeptide ABC transporter ATP-binding protein [Acinetobacter haemolyticus]|nr:oligopeptide ABC transporter ATP-binding protein [Acinetobacter haemolyticus]